MRPQSARKKHWLVCTLFALLVNISSGVNSQGLHSPQDPLLVVASGQYQGTWTDDGKIAAFLGVPFARAPVATLRWAPPQPLPASAENRLAQQFAPACMQGTYISDWYRDISAYFGADAAAIEDPLESEDCLYLNIWTPAAGGNPPHPVLVYIHGGSNKGGWSYEPNLIGETLSRRGIVVVTIAYRLGMFGFFAHPELEQLNFGLQDQVAALHWIKNYIAAAGGDPDKVTLMGESSGANDIDFLIASPATTGLFRQVIHHSGGSALRGRTDRNEYLEMTHVLSDSLPGGQPARLQELRSIHAASLMNASSALMQGRYMDPVIDGDTVNTAVTESLRRSIPDNLALLIGHNGNERLSSIKGDWTVDGWLEKNTTPAQAARLRRLLPANTPRRETLDRLDSAYYYLCPSLWLAQQFRARNLPVWYFEFTRQREGDAAAAIGAYHGAELPYVFDTHDDWLPTTAVDRKITAWMINYWANFVKTGNPNGDKLPPWVPFDESTPTMQRIDNEVSHTQHSSAALCEILLDAPPWQKH